MKAAACSRGDCGAMAQAGEAEPAGNAATEWGPRTAGGASARHPSRGAGGVGSHQVGCGQEWSHEHVTQRDDDLAHCALRRASCSLRLSSRGVMSRSRSPAEDRDAGDRDAAPARSRSRSRSAERHRRSPAGARSPHESHTASCCCLGTRFAAAPLRRQLHGLVVCASPLPAPPLGLLCPLCRLPGLHPLTTCSLFLRRRRQCHARAAQGGGWARLLRPRPRLGNRCAPPASGLPQLRLPAHSPCRAVQTRQACVRTSAATAP